VTDTSSTILVVDDDPVIRAVVRVMLERASYEVLEAADVGEATERLNEREDFAAVVCDYQLPDGSGLDLLESRPWIRDRFILMTGTTEREELRDDRVGSVDVYLTKPVGSDALKAAVDRVTGAAAHASS